jgi:hypothetical protein
VAADGAPPVAGVPGEVPAEVAGDAWDPGDLAGDAGDADGDEPPHAPIAAASPTAAETARNEPFMDPSMSADLDYGGPTVAADGAIRRETSPKGNEHAEKDPSDLRLDAATAGAGPAGPVH